MVQPTRHPIIRHSIDTADTVTVRSAMPGNETGWMIGAPSKTTPS